MPRRFLSAVWSNLVLVTYRVDPGLITPLLPDGLEPDTRDGDSFVSLVAFDFHSTRVLGIRWPGLTNFPEINLRTYVRERASGRRGVVFIRELVPKRLIVAVASMVYNEPYAHASMRSRVSRDANQLSIEHTWRHAGRFHHLLAQSLSPPSTPDDDSFEHFIKEHIWGYGRDRRGRTLVYEVVHPVWQTHAVSSLELEVDFASLYGDRWGFLTNLEPVSTVIAAGSPIEVFGHARLKTDD